MDQYETAVRAIEAGQAVHQRQPSTWAELAETVELADVLRMAEVLANTDLTTHGPQ